MTRVKICGLTRVEDALVADQEGADAVGLIFAPSPRQVTAHQAAQIERSLSPWITRVGVFVNPTMHEIERVLTKLRLDVLQLHGDETPEFADQVKAAFRLGVVKGIRVRDAETLQRLDDYDVDAFLLDTYVPGRAGGTGERFDWQLAIPLVEKHRIILAGGLTADNVTDAVQLVRPYGVDVASGVEREPGVKDHRSVGQFIARVRDLEET